MNFKNSFLLPTIWLAFACTGGVISVLFGAHLYLSPSLPSVESLRDVRLQTPLRIYSSDGKLIGEIGEKRRKPIKHQDIPQGYIDALLSAEDAQFYSHKGVSIKGLMRAVSQLLISGDIQGGGSTITMQVARHFFLTKKQEFKRKFNEILLALRIERELSKDQILELYVNVNFLGNRAYGIEAASQVYYGTSIDELELPQLAMLAGIYKAPSTMNPIANPERAKQRRDWILGRMLELGKIDQSMHDQAVQSPVIASYHGSTLDIEASYVTEMARLEALERFGKNAYTDGYKVFTTIQSDLQKTAQKAIIDGLITYDRRHGYRGPENNVPPPEGLSDILISYQANELERDTPEQGNSETETEGAPTSTEKAMPETLAEIHQLWIENGQDILKGTPHHGGLLPVMVSQIHKNRIDVINEEATVFSIPWEEGLSWAKPYISANQRGKAPSHPLDVVNLGDIIRIDLSDPKTPKMTQLPNVEGALVSIDASNGAILSLVGGFDFQQSNFNRATQSKRQPGSNFKPFVYAAAIENGYTAASMINDAPRVFNDSQLESTWRPENSSGKFYGPTRLREALYKSRNLVSIRLLESLGISTAVKTISEFGIDTSELPGDLSMALGAHGMTPVSVAAGYALFANGGYKISPYLISHIIDVNEDTVYEANPALVCQTCEDPTTNDDLLPTEAESTRDEADLISAEPKTPSAEPSTENQAEEQDTKPINIAPRTMSEEVAYIMDSILKDAVLKGTATRARVLNRADAAGKTGTTNNFSDAWFSGYAGGVVTTTWVGFDELETLGNREYGGTAALPIWIDYMKTALKDRPVYIHPRPPGLLSVRINPKNGLRTTANNPNGIFELFRESQLPEFEDNTPDINLDAQSNDESTLTPENIF